MPPRAKTTKKNSGDTGKRHPLNMRTTAELRRRLEDAAKKSGMSLTQEVERRLDHSFAGADVVAQVLGGAEFRQMAINLAASFSRGARHEARRLELPEPAAEVLLRDPRCYREGMLDVVRDLLRGLPFAAKNAAELHEEREALKLFLTTAVDSELVRRGHLRFDFGDGRGPVGSGFIEDKQ